KVLRNSTDELSSFVNKKEVGEYLKNLFFSYGSIYKWDKLIKTATGEDLTPNYWIKQFVDN
ncbi:MAG: carboxypeptidase M32, partial [Arcobacter sp.]|nr:carboxypeptidase M32 [Arcobacter sp.]